MQVIPSVGSSKTLLEAKRELDQAKREAQEALAGTAVADVASRVTTFGRALKQNVVKETKAEAKRRGWPVD